VAVLGKIRYLHAAAPATLTPGEDGDAQVAFSEPQRAMTPGQSLVLYDGDRVAAGGVIEEVAAD
jgi:tRNA-specific 2-thiouridylase